MNEINTWKGFRNYQKFAHRVIALQKKNDKDTGTNLYELMQDELDEMLEDIIMQGDTIQEVSVAWSNCDTHKITLKVQIAPTASYKTRVVLMSFIPDWIGIKFEKLDGSCADALKQLKKWLMAEVGA